MTCSVVGAQDVKVIRAPGIILDSPQIVYIAKIPDRRSIPNILSVMLQLHVPQMQNTVSPRSLMYRWRDRRAG